MALGDSTAARGARRPTWSLVGALALAALGSAWILTRPTPVTLGGDAEMLQHPLLVDAVRQVREGRLPVWTAGRWGGSPLLADPVVGAMYPPYYVAYLLTPYPHWRALDVSTCLHLALLTTGMVCLLTRLGVGPVAAVAIAGMAALSPNYVYAARGWQQYWAALAYWPWLFWAAATLAHAPAVRPAIVAAVALAAQVYAGYPEFSLYSGIPALLWIVVARGVVGGSALVLPIGLGAIAIAAPLMFAGLDMARDSIRIGPGAAEMMDLLDRHFSLSWAQWRDAARAIPLAPLAPTKIAPAIVALAVLGAVGGGFAGRFFVVVAIVAALLTRGEGALYHTVRHVPPFSFFGAPLKFFFPFSFALLVLAGLGLARAATLPTAWQRLAVVIVGGAAAMACGAAPTTTALLAAVAVLLAAAPASLLPSLLAATAFVGSVAFVVSTRALATGMPFVPVDFIEVMRRPPAVVPRDGARMLVLRDHASPGQTGLNYGALWGIESWNGMADLLQRRQQRVLEAVTPGSAVGLVRQLGADPVVVHERSLAAQELADAGFATGGRLDRLLYLTSPAPPAPRVALAPRAEAVSGEAAAAAARFGRALDAERVLIEADVLPGGAEGDAGGTLRVLEQRPGMVRARVTVARPTWLVVREPYYRNWRATIDGRPATVYPAGGFLLGVLVDAGAHEVHLAYRERGLLPGAVLAVLAMLALPMVLRRVVVRARRVA